MIPNILLAVGGLGLFLLGMMIMTEGLKELAGHSLRRVLAKYTTNTVSGAAAGAVSTAIVQSSSATTVTAIGFVGAGLMTFPQALGVLFGANIGTTMTGWLVAIVGFKLDLGVVVLPIVLVGAFLKMFGRGRVKPLGWALAGFSLLFIGIDTMQQGMAAFEGQITPDSFPSDTVIGRLQLVLIGVAITLVTQSSSAGVATAMVALSSGAVSFPQAAAMVIGMDIGTSFTGYLATIGGSTPMRQTGYAHVIYNVITGIMAFILLNFYADFVGPLLENGGTGDAQVALVAFHTIFNTTGVIAVLPFAKQFADFITQIVPERGSKLTRLLEEKLIDDASAAIDAASATARYIAADLFSILVDLLDPHLRDDAEQRRLAEIGKALTAVEFFLSRVKTEPSQTNIHPRHVSTVHAVDHLSRLYVRCVNSAPLKVRRNDKRLQRLARILESTLHRLGDQLYTEGGEQYLDRIRNLLRHQRHSYRHRLIVQAANGQIDAEQTGDRLDSIRWLHRSTYHVWRIVHHLRKSEDVALFNNAPSSTG